MKNLRSINMKKMYQLDALNELARPAYSKNNKMSHQSEGTVTSEDDSLEDVVLAMMKEKGILSQVKGQIAKFIQDNGRVNSKRFIISERADENILSYIYEYLQWIGMKQTCSVLLSESPVQVDFVIPKKTDSNYRPKLNTLLDQLPSELQSKFLRMKGKDLESKEGKAKDDNAESTLPPTKRLDDLIDPPKSLEKSIDNNSFITSTPNIKKDAAADATFTKELDSTSDLLMGFNTPIFSDGIRSQSGQYKKSFQPERLFQDDPFQIQRNANDTDKIKSTRTDLSTPGPNTLMTNEVEIPYKVTKSVEQFLQDEEEIKALEEQEEDLKKTEDEVMESSLSTEWSEEELVPSSKDKDILILKDPEQENFAKSLSEQNFEENENSGVDRSKIYEVADDFEEQDSESRKLGSLPTEGQEQKLAEFNLVPDQEPERNYKEDQAASNSNKSSKQSSAKDKEDAMSNSKQDVQNSNNSNKVSNKEVRSSRKKSETEDLSTSDMLSMDMEEDTQDMSIPSENVMSSCEYVVSIK